MKRDRTKQRHLILISVLLVLVFALVLTLPSLSYQFLDFDDQTVIVNNPRLHLSSMDDLLRLFTPEPTPATVEYMPVKDLSLAIDVELFGMSSPHMRIQNIFWYAMCGLAAFFFFHTLLSLLARWSGETLQPFRLNLLALLATLLFLAHPVHVNSWAWLSSRKDLLSGAFGFGSIALYLRYRMSGGVIFICLSLCLFILALFSKPTVLFIPFFLMIIEALDLLENRLSGRSETTRLKERAFTIALFVLPSLIFVAIYHFTVTVQMGTMVQIATEETVEAPYGAPFIWPVQLFQYFKMIFWPVGLQVRQIYRFPELASGLWFFHLGLLFLSFAILLMGTIKRQWSMVIGLVFFLGSLSPMVLSNPFGQYWATRYLFFAPAGIILPIAWYGMNSSASSRNILVAGLVLVFILASLVFPYSQCFSSSRLFWTCHVEHDADHWIAVKKLARSNLMDDHIAEAAELADRCLTINPDSIECALVKGLSLFDQGDPLARDKAFKLLHQVADKDHTGRILRNLAIMYAKTDRQEKALEIYAQGMDREKTLVRVADVIKYANFLWAVGKREQALEELERAKRERAFWESDPSELIQSLLKKMDEPY